MEKHVDEFSRRMAFDVFYGLPNIYADFIANNYNNLGSDTGHDAAQTAARAKYRVKRHEMFIRLQIMVLLMPGSHTASTDDSM